MSNDPQSAMPPAKSPSDLIDYGINELGDWRGELRRWDDAVAMFTARVWIDPSGSLGEFACLDAVRARRRWTRT